MTAGHERPREEWIEIPVPALVSEERFARAQELLQENKVRSRRRTIEPSIVQGMVRCQKYFDGSSLWVCARRMERGRLRWPEGERGRVQLSREEFALLLGGIDLGVTRKRTWYRRQVGEEPQELRTSA